MPIPSAPDNHIPDSIDRPLHPFPAQTDPPTKFWSGKLYATIPQDITKLEFDAIITGLEMLAEAITNKAQWATYTKDILTDGGSHRPIALEELLALIERIN